MVQCFEDNGRKEGAESTDTLVLSHSWHRPPEVGLREPQSVFTMLVWMPTQDFLLRSSVSEQIG